MPVDPASKITASDEWGLAAIQISLDQKSQLTKARRVHCGSSRQSTMQRVIESEKRLSLITKSWGTKEGLHSIYVKWNLPAKIQIEYPSPAVRSCKFSPI